MKLRMKNEELRDLSDPPMLSILHSAFCIPLNVQVRHVEGVIFDKLAAWFDLISHQNGKYLVCLDGIHMTEPYHRLMAKEWLKLLAGARGPALATDTRTTSPRQSTTSSSGPIRRGENGSSPARGSREGGGA